MYNICVLKTVITVIVCGYFWKGARAFLSFSFFFFESSWQRVREIGSFYHLHKCHSSIGDLGHLISFYDVQYLTFWSKGFACTPSIMYWYICKIVIPLRVWCACRCDRVEYLIFLFYVYSSLFIKIRGVYCSWPSLSKLKRHLFLIGLKMRKSQHLDFMYVYLQEFFCVLMWYVYFPDWWNLTNISSSDESA